MINLTVDQIKALAQLERDMDSGKTPYAVFEGERIALNEEVMEHLGLETKQNINRTILSSIQNYYLAEMKAKQALEKITKH